MASRQDRAAAGTAKGVMTKEHMVFPSSRVSTDDIFILFLSRVGVDELLQCYHKLFMWTSMKSEAYHYSVALSGKFNSASGVT